MATLTYEYRVTITFDLSYSKSPEYRYINSFLDDKGFSSLKSIDEHMPSNIYTGTVSITIDTAGPNPTFNELKCGADKAVRNTYDSIKRNAENADLTITLYVQASLELATSSRKKPGVKLSSFGGIVAGANSVSPMMLYRRTVH